MLDFEVATKRIYNLLLINSSCLSDINSSYELMMSHSIYFYFEYSLTNNFISKKYADRLILQLIGSLNNSFESYRTISRVAFNLEYLVQNNFCKIISPRIIEKLDYKIFYEVSITESTDIVALISLGKYLQLRHEIYLLHKNLNYHEFLIHVTDKMLRLYDTVNTEVYILSSLDVTVIKFLNWCKSNEINLYAVERTLYRIEKLINGIAFQRSNIVVQLSLLHHFGRNNDVLKNKGFKPSKDINELQIELFLLLDMSKDLNRNNYLQLVSAILKQHIATSNPIHHSIIGLSKGNSRNYYLDGFSGWGMILLSSLNNFDNLKWLDLFL